MRAARLGAGVLCLAGACSRSLDFPALDPAYISGRVVQAQADTGLLLAVPFPQASVPGTNLRAVGDEGGRFSLGPLPPGAYRLLLAGADSSGRPRQRILENVRVSPGLPPLADIVLHENADVVGRAVLADGQNHNVGITAFVPGLSFSVSTGDNGVYFLRGLPEGPARIGAYHAGYQGATVDLELQGGVLTTARDLVLERLQDAPAPGSLSGTVQVIGHAASGVRVSAQPAGGAPVSTVTVDGGAWSLPALPPGLYAARFELDGYAGAELDNLLVAPGASVVLAGVILSPPGAANLDGGFPARDAGQAGGPDGGASAGGDAGLGAQCRADSDCASGRLCEFGVCVGCATDASCRAGFVCKGGDCVPACNGNADCPSALACIAQVCSACAVDVQCRAGQICQPAGCVTGCRQNADCAPGSVCAASLCGPCTQDTQCAASGFLCLPSGCTPGDCRTYADCPAGQGCGPGRFCGTCQSNSECGGAPAGRVCTANHVCVAGQCGRDADCGLGFACDLSTNLCEPNTAVVTARSPSFVSVGFGTGAFVSSDAGVFVARTGSPTLLQPDAGALVPTWTGPQRLAVWTGAAVLPARGYPGDALYLASPGSNGIAVGAGDGASYWPLPGIASGELAVGVSGGFPVVAWASSSSLYSVRADGTPLLANAPIGCTPRTGPAFGASSIYVLCPAALVAFDPQTGSVQWQVAHGSAGAGGSSVAVTLDDNSPISLWRPPGAPQETAIFGGHFVLNSVGYAYLYAVRGGALLWATPIAGIDGPAAVPLIDGSGAITMVTRTGAFSRVDVNGALLVTGSASGLTSSYAALASDGTVIGCSGTSLAGVSLQPDAGVTNWTFSFPLEAVDSASWPHFLSFGGLAVWGVQAGGNYSAAVLHLPGGLSAPPAPAWPIHGGNAEGQLRAPSWECAADADCASPKACVLGRCVFDCQSAADCPGGAACVPDAVGGRSHCAGTCRDAVACGAAEACLLNRCGACAADSSCRAGQVCAIDACFDCPAGAVCCHSAAECGGACVHGRCLPGPALDLVDPADGGVSLAPDGGVVIGGTAASSAGSDGTVYLVYTEPGTNLFRLAAVDAQATLLWTAPLTGSTSGSLEPPLVVAPADGGPDTVFWTNTGARKVAQVSGGATVLADLTAVLPSYAQGAMLSQGVSGGRQAVFGYGDQIIFALDAQTLQLLWKANSNCSSTPADLELQVGSDGTVYRVCGNGLVQAWDPDGLGSAGRQLWAQFPVPLAPMAGVLPHTSIARPNGSANDVLYVGESTAGCPPALDQLQVSAAGAGKNARTLLPYGACGGDPGQAVDRDGYVYALRSVYLDVVSPGGALLQSLAVGFQTTQGSGFALSDDGILYAVADNQLTGFLISPASHKVSRAFSLYGPGGAHYDQGFPLLLPSTATGGAPRILIDALGPPRVWSGVSLTSGAGLMPAPASSTQGGDNLRRNSLRTR